MVGKGLNLDLDTCAGLMVLATSYSLYIRHALIVTNS